MSKPIATFTFINGIYEFYNKQFHLSICTEMVYELTDASGEAISLEVEIYSEEVEDCFVIELDRDDGESTAWIAEDGEEIGLDWDTEKFLLKNRKFKNYDKLYAVVYENIPLDKV